MRPMAQQLLWGSRRVRNDKLKRELGVTLRYPDYRAGLRALFAEPRRLRSALSKRRAAADAPGSRASHRRRTAHCRRSCHGATCRADGALRIAWLCFFATGCPSNSGATPGPAQDCVAGDERSGCGGARHRVVRTRRNDAHVAGGLLAARDTTVVDVGPRLLGAGPAWFQASPARLFPTALSRPASALRPARLRRSSQRTR